MPSGFQAQYEHEIPKEDRPCGPRINLTFRWIDVSKSTFIPKARVVHCMKETYDVYIGRKNDKAGLSESKWHNPFFGDGSVERFRAYIQTRPDLLAALPELKGKILGCWCKGTSRTSCHGDVLAELADKEEGK